MYYKAVLTNNEHFVGTLISFRFIHSISERVFNCGHSKVAKYGDGKLTRSH